MYKIFCAVTFWGFIAVKAVGHIFTLWSWWWVLLPLVPWIVVVAQRMGL